MLGQARRPCVGGLARSAVALPRIYWQASGIGRFASALLAQLLAQFGVFLGRQLPPRRGLVVNRHAIRKSLGLQYHAQFDTPLFARGISMLLDLFPLRKYRHTGGHANCQYEPFVHTVRITCSCAMVPAQGSNANVPIPIEL